MQGDSLEEPNLPVTPAPILDGAPTGLTPPEAPRGHQPKKILAIVVVIVAIALLGGLIAITKSASKPAAKTQTPARVTINTQSLDNGTLNKLVAQNAPNQPTRNQLVITPETLFKSNLLANGNLQVDGNSLLKGSLTTNGAAVFQGSTAINGNAAVRGSLGVGGQLSAGSISVGSLNVTNVTASGNLQFGGHILPGGSTPTVKPSVATSGGSASIVGNDTAGTVTITIGEPPLRAGELAIITFRTAFAGTPKVQITPITADSTAIRYYATRSASQFTINSANLPAADTTYVFDYQVTQ